MILHFQEKTNHYEGREAEIDSVGFMLTEEIDSVIDFIRDHTELHDELAPTLNKCKQGIVNKLRSLKGLSSIINK